MSPSEEKDSDKVETPGKRSTPTRKSSRATSKPVRYVADSEDDDESSDGSSDGYEPSDDGDDEDESVSNSRVEKELIELAKNDKEVDELLMILKANPKMSAYECRRKLNIINNEKILKGLGLEEVKKSLEPAKPVKKKYTKRVQKTPEEIELLRARKSSRRTKTVDYNDDLDEKEHDDVISDDEKWVEGVSKVNEYFKEYRAK